MTKHPSLSYFGDTRSQSFPLLLVIGREPNTSLPIDKCIAPYDFRDHYPKGKFWDNAYGLLAEVAGSTCKQLKRLCIKVNASPVIFANALPIGIENKVPDKRSGRRSVAQGAEGHITFIFFQDELIDRVSMVIASV